MSLLLYLQPAVEGGGTSFPKAYGGRGLVAGLECLYEEFFIFLRPEISDLK